MGGISYHRNKNSLQGRKRKSWSCFEEGERLQITSNGEQTNCCLV